MWLTEQLLICSSGRPKFRNSPQSVQPTLHQVGVLPKRAPILTEDDMAIKVVTSQTAWAGFVRRAKRAFPNEHIEAIWGDEAVDTFRVTEFKPLKINKTTPNSIDYDDTELKRQKWMAEKASKVFLGTIHTHPKKDFDTAPSQTDHHESTKDEKIIGVAVLYKKKDSSRFVIQTDWWFPQKRIEFEILPE